MRARGEGGVQCSRVRASAVEWPEIGEKGRCGCCSRTIDDIEIGGWMKRESGGLEGQEDRHVSQGSTMRSVRELEGLQRLSLRRTYHRTPHVESTSASVPSFGRLDLTL